MTKHIQIIQATEHMEWMNSIPVQILLIDGEEVEIEGNTNLITAIQEVLSEEDIADDGSVHNGCIEVLNTMLDQGHPDFDIDFYQSILETM